MTVLRIYNYNNMKRDSYNNIITLSTEGMIIMSMQKIYSHLHERYNTQRVKLGTYTKLLGIDPQLFM